MFPEFEFTRRELLVAGAVAAGHALGARPVGAAIATDAEGLVAGEVEIPQPDGAMPAYRAKPAEGASFPVVVVAHEIFGVDEYIRDVCRRLAKENFLAVAPDLYRRQGEVSKLAGIQEIVDRVVAKVPDAQVLADLDATFAWARSHGGAPQLAAITGFSWGGRIVWLYAAHNPELVAGAAWYGRLVGPARELTPRHPIDLADGKLAPVLGLYGGEDRGIPLETVFAMRRKLAEAGQKSEIMIFPTAPHGFHADPRESYRPMAAREAWRRMREWFYRHGLHR